jgi:hypothetical protein
VKPLLNRDSAIFGLAVELYQWHTTDRWGRCACGTPRCPVRVRAAGVIRAAGLEPTTFDAPEPTPSPTPPPAVMTHPTVPLELLRLPHRERGRTLADEAELRRNARRSGWWDA